MYEFVDPFSSHLTIQTLTRPTDDAKVGFRFSTGLVLIFLFLDVYGISHIYLKLLLMQLSFFGADIDQSEANDILNGGYSVGEKRILLLLLRYFDNDCKGQFPFP